MSDEETLPPGVVARMFRVTTKTLGRWVTEGKLTEIRTSGGHRRYIQREVEDLLEQRKKGKETRS